MPYPVPISLEGESACNITGCVFTPSGNATGYKISLNGTQYAVCATVQYGYKPSSNVTVLTLKPEGTDTMTAAKSPEQMQQEARQSGALTVHNEWSW